MNTHLNAAYFAQVSPLSVSDEEKVNALLKSLVNDWVTLEGIKKGYIDINLLLKDYNVRLPEGWHAHFGDEYNIYYPPEAAPINQIANKIAVSKDNWQRVEVRFGTQDICIILCGMCT